MIIIETERLFLRTWQEKDIEPYYQIMQDPEVIEFLRGSLTKQQCSDFVHAANRHQEALGYTLWATELKNSGELIGFIGLNDLDFFGPSNLPFAPATEIGWRLGSQFWSKGYATEGAKAALEYGFLKCGLNQIVSFTSPSNIRSIKVMGKIGLKRDSKRDFHHPKLALDHPLSKQILYRLKKKESAFSEL